MRKKMKFIIMVLALMLIFPCATSASGGISISTGNISMNQGSSKTLTVTATNAFGRVDISSSNPAVATVSLGRVFLDNNSATVTIYGAGVGSAVIYVKSIDVATYDSEVVTSNYAVNVNVATKPSSNTSNSGSSSSNNSNSQNSNTRATDKIKSSNTKLKTIQIPGYNLEFSDGKYTLTVINTVDKINIVASAEDDKATVMGIGEKNLQIGENTFVIKVVAEDGASKDYKIVITRKNNEYYLKDIDEFIANKADVLLLSDNDVITKDNIDKLKSLNKTITLVKNNKNNEFVYSLAFDAKDLKKPFKTAVKVKSKGKVNEKFKNIKGINVLVDKNVPQNTLLKLNVKGKFANNDKVRIYKIENGEPALLDMDIISDNITSFKLDNASEYFLTTDNLVVHDLSNDHVNKHLIPLVLGVLCLITLAVAATYLIIKRKKSKKENFEIKKSSEEFIAFNDQHIENISKEDDNVNYNEEEGLNKLNPDQITENINEDMNAFNYESSINNSDTLSNSKDDTV